MSDPLTESVINELLRHNRYDGGQLSEDIGGALLHLRNLAKMNDQLRADLEAARKEVEHHAKSRYAEVAGLVAATERLEQEWDAALKRAEENDARIVELRADITAAIVRIETAEAERDRYRSAIEWAIGDCRCETDDRDECERCVSLRAAVAGVKGAT